MRQMTTHIKRIERVETELEKVVKNAAGKSDVESLRAEYKKLIVSWTGVGLLAEGTGTDRTVGAGRFTSRPSRS